LVQYLRGFGANSCDRSRIYGYNVAVPLDVLEACKNKNLEDKNMPKEKYYKNIKYDMLCAG
jgi:hypothetical protein